MRKLNLYILLLLFGTPSLLTAQTLDINEEDIARLGIEFAPATGINSRSGTRVPASVINSPEGPSTITARYPGTVEKWFVEPGATVSAGQALARLNSQQAIGIQQDWIAASIAYQQAEFNRKKDQQLFDAGVIAQQRLKETERNFQQATFYYNAMAETMRLAGFDKNASEKLASGDSKPGTYFITASAEGILTQRHYDAGDYVEDNQLIASLQYPAPLWVRARIPANLAEQLQVGQQLSLAGTDEKLLLKQKDHEVNFVTQTVEFLAEFSQPSTLMPGQIVSLIVPPARDGVLVPASAVVHNGDNTSVFVRTTNGVEIRNLVLHPVGESYLATEGLATGEEIAVKGTAVLKGIQLGLGGGE